MDRPHFDCFAYSAPHSDGCAVLTERVCEGCRTYKTREQCEQERKETLAKLRAKPYPERLAIAEKYKIKEILKDDPDRDKSPWARSDADKLD